MFAGFYYANMKEYIYTNHRKRIRRYIILVRIIYSMTQYKHKRNIVCPDNIESNTYKK